MMNVGIFIAVAIVVAFISVLIIKKLMKDYIESVKEEIASLKKRIMPLDVLLIKKDISALKAFMPLFRLDKEKIRKVLFEFAEANNLEKLKYYMEIGILFKSDINMQDDNDQTFGHIAVKKKNKDMFDWFLENGGKTDISGGEDDETVDDILDGDPEVQMWRAVNKQ